MGEKINYYNQLKAQRQEVKEFSSKIEPHHRTRLAELIEKNYNHIGFGNQIIGKQLGLVVANQLDALLQRALANMLREVNVAKQQARLEATQILTDTEEADE